MSWKGSVRIIKQDSEQKSSTICMLERVSTLKFKPLCKSVETELPAKTPCLPCHVCVTFEGFIKGGCFQLLRVRLAPATVFTRETQTCLGTGYLVVDLSGGLAAGMLTSLVGWLLGC